MTEDALTPFGDLVPWAACRILRSQRFTQLLSHGDSSSGRELNRTGST